MSPRQSHVDLTLAEITSDLARRWTAARRAALRKVLARSPEPQTGPLQGAGDDDNALVERAMAADRAATLDAVFQHSLALGRGFRRYFGVDLTLPDLARLLPQAGAPCHEQGLHPIGAAIGAATGAAIGEAPARRSERVPCGATPAQCAIWREATHGLVSGVSSSVYFTRVASPLGDAASCADLIHLEAQSGARYQPMPDAVRRAVQDASSELARVVPGTRVEVLGVQEGALDVRVHCSGASCGIDLFAVLQRALARSTPALLIRDASAKPVLAP